ncbi:hypothetical protein NCS52_00275500 [Fusarium sp. LHS14.1]|nr:hypothetical protein NCS52_00275500 [Fusarium sp. LHS14.1]
MNLHIQRSPPLGAESLNLRHAKQLCLQRVHDCTAQQNAELAAHAKDLEQMLQLWAKHSGVDARKGMSLDDRLKDHPDLKATLIGLLELIEQKVTQALSSPDDHGDPEKSPATVPRNEDDVDPDEFLIKQKWKSYSGSTWEAVGAAVDMLIELTAMIRKSTVRNSSLPTHFHRPDDYFAEYAKILARNWFRDARKSLTDQLGDSVFVQRRQMLYNMKHREKISYPAADLAPTSTKPTAAPSRTVETIPRMERPQNPTPQIKSPRPTAPIFADLTPSSTNLSQLDKTKLAQRSRRIEALSGITEGSVSLEDTKFSYMYPEPRTWGETQGYGVCPYCSGFLPASKLTKIAWRKHLHEDLHHYVCISQKCQDPIQFFSNSKQWLQHMKELHGRDWPQKVHMATWYCDRDHDRMEYKGESELRKHLVNDHGSVSNAHVDALVRRNWGVGCREAHVCPLCESKSSNIIPSMNDEDKESLLLRHIGDHLKALALFSLPSLNTDPDSDGQHSSSGVQLPTNDDSKADIAGKNQEVAQSDENLEGSLTFDDDPHRIVDAISSEGTINEEHISDVPSGLDAALEWKFAGLEQEAPELDSALENLRVGHEEKQQTIDPREQLKGAIRAEAVKSAFGEKSQWFFPNGSFDNLFTKEFVTRELWAELPTQAQREGEVEILAEFISNSARNLFAIVVLLPDISSGQVLQKRMEFFRHKNITDSSLPLQVSWWSENYWYGMHADATGDDFGGDLENGGLWRHTQIRDFSSLQHWFLAPVFSTIGLSYDLKLGTILPVTERDPDVDHSSFEFIRYKIHGNHIDQRTMNTRHPYYVEVRKAHGDVSESHPHWETQVKRLSDANHLIHEHLVRISKRSEEGLTSELVKDAFRQMAGLTSALNMLHYGSEVPYFSTGHFNPDHIFSFSNDNDNDNELGTLRIAGWELWLRIGSAIHDNDYEAEGDWRYDAPEFSSPGPYFKSRSCACDVWSMGCIMLEFLIWLMYGMDGLDRFRQAKQSSLSRVAFFCQAKREAQDGMPVFTVDPVVLKWMDHMAADPACKGVTTALGDLLELIRTRLLVINPPQQRRLTITAGSSQDSVGAHFPIVGQSQHAWERCMTGELDERMRKISYENPPES